MASPNRIVMQKVSHDGLTSFDPVRPDAAEVKGNWVEKLRFRSFHDPGHDPCTGAFMHEQGKMLK